MIRSVIIGCGGYLPETRISNDDLAARGVDTTDEWIRERTGIHARRFAAEGQFTSHLAIEASQRALEDAGRTPADIDLIIVGTTTPDQTFPSVAARVQGEMGVPPGTIAFDVQAVCSGFLYALGVADSMLKAGQARRALVIGAEELSRIIDFNDRTTCVLFGDGAGAIVLEAQDSEGGLEARGIHSVHLHADGRYYDALGTNEGPSSTQTVGYVHMDGREVFRHAVVNLHDVMLETLEANGLNASDIDWVVPHQANLRILDSTAKKLGIDPDRIIKTIQEHANTSAASVPLALATAKADGRIKPGQLLLLEAMGGGFTWGGALVRL